MKAIISGGGTGGHIYPAVSIIEELEKREKNIEILYIGKQNGLESEIIKNLGINYKGIRIAGIPRKISLKSIKSLRELLFGLWQSRKLIKEFNPDFVIGTGGYVTGPVLFNASKLKYKTYFHEQNSYPGITNKILSRFVDSYFVTYEDSIKYFKNKNNALITGNPIRNKFNNIKDIRDNSIKEFGLDKNIRTIFSFGGSNGSEILNENILEILNSFNKEIFNFQIIHVTGKNHYRKFMDRLKNHNENIIIFPYLEDIQKAYSVSDLVITSSGAITLSELAFLGLPSILIPKSYTTENHQVHNAITYEKIGASKVILEKDLNPNILNETISDIISNESVLNNMAKNASLASTPNASTEIINKVLKDFYEKKQ